MLAEGAESAEKNWRKMWNENKKRPRRGQIGIKNLLEDFKL